jgi:hypothetical protein
LIAFIVPIVSLLRSTLKNKRHLEDRTL